MPNESINKSVQIKPQYEEMPRSSYVLSLASIADDITPWGGNPHARDILLRSFWPTEPYLASAIYTIVSRNVAFNWTLDGPPRTVKIIQDMLHNADLGRGWLSFITKLSIDLFTCDNGAFIEVIRDGLSETSPVIGIANLDSGRCRRTGVPDWPVVYTDRNGAEHKMLPWQIITVEEFPSPIETMNNVQMCAVSRILRMAQLMRDIAIYKREKVSGHARAIDLVSGIRTQEIEDALKSHNEEQLAMGFIRYVKPMIFGTLDPNAKVAHERIDLSSLPDGFDEEVTMKWYISLLAMGFGADFQDFAPLPGGGLGSSQQSQILHQKSRGKGPALFMKILEHKFNFHGVIPQNITFRYDEQDTAGDMEQASLAKMRADTANVYVMNGVLTPEAVRQQMLDRGELTQEEFDKLNIEPDITPDVVANDNEPLENAGKSRYKFNENHDPENGQFAAGEGGGSGSNGGGKVSSSEAAKYYENREIPEGYYVHGRSGDQELSNENVIQLTQDWDVADQYSDEDGSKWLMKPKSESDILDYSSPDTNDMDDLVSKAVEDYGKGNLPFAGDIEASLGVERGELSDDELEEEIRNNFAPEDIVNSAAAYDNVDWVNWLYEKTDRGFIKTPNGGAVALDKSSVDATKVPNGKSRKALKRPDFMGRERRKAEAAFQEDIQKALSDSLADFKKKILSNKSKKEYLPFADDIINDEEMWENFRVRVVGAAQPHFRNGALQAAAYNANLGLAVNMDMVNQAVLDFTRTYANDWWLELAKVTRDGLRKAILNWQEGKLPGKQGLDDLVNSITPLFGEDRARRIAITETTRIFDEGNKLSRISAGIKYEQWQTAEQDSVCPQCSELNEQYFGINEGPRPPLHINCICARLPAANYNPVE
jgi:hypothetical protein